MLYNRNEYNVVNQAYFNIRKKKLVYQGKKERSQQRNQFTKQKDNLLIGRKYLQMI